MKTLSQFLFATVILFATGCAAQKQTASTDVAASESAQLHQEALKALEGRMFIVRAEEFFLKPGENAILSPNSYFFMQGNRGFMSFEQKVLPNTSYDWLIIEDSVAEIKRVKTKKNGDIEFFVKINKPDQKYTSGEMELILYGNSNRCSVIRGNGRYDMRFTGTVLPYVE